MLRYRTNKSKLGRNGDDMSDNGSGFETDDIWVTDFNTEAAIEFNARVKHKFMESPNNPIVININSFGGEVSALLSMMDTMDTVRTMNPNMYFITCVSGVAYSAGADLLAHGDYRVAAPKSSIMIHQASAGAYGHIEDLKVSVNEHDRLNDLSAKIFMENIGRTATVNAYKKLTPNDRYLSPEEAEELGIVDYVGYLRMEMMLVARPQVDGGAGLPERRKQLREYIQDKDDKPKRKTGKRSK